MSNIEYMKTFAAVVEHNSFSTAANKLFTSQSAVSHQVKALEKLLGFPLFDHKSRSCQLTEAGALFYERATALISLYDLALQDANDIIERKPSYGRLFISTTPNLYSHMGAKLLKIYWKHRPEVQVSFVNSNDALEDLINVANRSVDLTYCVESAEIARRGLEFWPVREFRECCIVEIESSLASTPPTLFELSRARVGFHYQKGLFSIEDDLREAIHDLNPKAEIVDTFMMKNVMLSSNSPDHYLLIPELFTFGGSTTRVMMPVDTDIRGRFGIATKPDPGPRIMDFVRCIQKHYRDNPDDSLM